MLSLNVIIECELFFGHSWISDSLQLERGILFFFGGVVTGTVHYHNLVVDEWRYCTILTYAVVILHFSDADYKMKYLVA